MLTALTQSLVPLTEIFAIASTMGLSSYLLFFWLRYRIPNAATRVDLAVILLSIFARVLPSRNFNINAVASSIAFLCVAGVVCAFGAVAERGLSSRNPSYKECFADLLAATSLSSSSLTYLANTTDIFTFFFKQINHSLESFMVLLLMCGLFLTPSAVSIFRWMFRTVQLQPGVDRHFREEEQEEKRNS